MSLASLRISYGVPAKRGGRVRFTDSADGVSREGVIVGARWQYLRVRFDGERNPRTLHPVWGVEYMPEDADRMAQINEAYRRAVG